MLHDIAISGRRKTNNADAPGRRYFDGSSERMESSKRGSLLKRDCAFLPLKYENLSEGKTQEKHIVNVVSGLKRIFSQSRVRLAM